MADISARCSLSWLGLLRRRSRRQHQAVSPRSPPLLAFAPVLVLFWACGAQADVVGCGGFVQASEALSKLRVASDPKLDYSLFTVELQNEEGLVKEKAQCAPNGYFFVPVYGQGSYQVSVKGPQGWTFQPEKVQVAVDAQSCNGNTDINFHYSGFSLSGKVLGARGVGPACDQGAPSGITITVLDSAQATAATVITSDDGTFLVPNLPVGEYELKATHPKWRIELLQTPKVQLGWGPVVLPDLFRVAGYDLSGTVLAQGNAVPGVPVFLFSSRFKKLANCPLGPGSPSPLPGRKPLCHALTDTNGVFVFPEVFCGEYDLVPQYSSNGAAVFELAPPSLSVNVTQGSAVLPEPFQVLGFSIGGRVFDSVGAGVSGAEILVNGELRATTDARGRYKLDKMTSAKYRIEARKAHYYFGVLEGASVVPGMSAIPTIVAEEYDICGQIVMDPDAPFERTRRVTLTHELESARPQSATVQGEAEFCFRVTPGVYQLLPHVSEAEVTKGLLFDPPSIAPKLVARPLTQNLFRQIHLSVSGNVVCKDVCDSGVRVSLSWLGPPSDSKAGNTPEKTPETRWLNLTDGSGEFVFEKVPKGRYRVQGVRPPNPAMVGDEWCWHEEGSVDVEVGDKAVSGLELRQKGWRLLINTTVPDWVDIADGSPEGVDYNLTVGMNEFCTEYSQVHSLMFMKGCFFYGSLLFEWDPRQPFVLTLNSDLVKVEGLAYLDSRQFKWANNITDYAYARILHPNGTSVFARNYLYVSKKANDSNPVAEFEWAAWLDPGEEYVVEPFHDGRLVPDYKSVDDLAREMRESAEREQQQLREMGLSDEQISQLDKELEMRRNRGEEIKDIAALLELKKAPEKGDEVEGKEEVEEEEEGEVLGSGAAEEAEGEAKNGSGIGGGIEQGGGEGEGAEVGSKEGEEAGEEEGEGAVMGGDISESSNTAAEDERDASYYEPEKAWPPLRRVLFYPRRQVFRMERHRCPEPPVPFQIRPGVYLEGTIDPPLSGVNVSVVADTRSETAEWEAGQVVASGLTREGMFIVGPLYDDATYHAEPSLEGYIFKPLGNNSFAAQQLASITVHIQNGPASSEDDDSSASVLLSLTGDGNFYKNAAAPPGTNHTFLGLFPGTFHLRPLLKEYEFTPAAVSIPLASGEQHHASFSAKRVAFSASGRVLSLTGMPEEGVHVEARTKDGSAVKHYETAITDSKGAFQLRGLQPQVAYSVQVVLKGASAGAAGQTDGTPPRFERASPKSRDVVVSSDVKDIEFVVFDFAPSVLTGTVDGPDAARWQPHISVEVLSHSTPSRVERSTQLPISRFFEFVDLPAGKYKVRLSFGLPGKTHFFEGQEAEADISTERVVHVGKLQFRASEKLEPQAGTCIPGGEGGKQCKW